MLRNILLTITLVALVVMLNSCGKTEPGGRTEPAAKTAPAAKFTGAKGEVKIITLDPGHFHAALVQKIMYDQVSPTVHVYAPEGPDVVDHLNRIKGFNTRSDNPTSWEEITYTGDDFLEKMIEEKLGNVVVISGNNRKKTKYIKACVDAGLNVLADKPMCIAPEDFDLLKEAFVSAKKNGVFIYDVMTERSSITTILQKELSMDKGVFGDQQVGTVDDPAVISESVHHFFKYVSGNPIKRPDWYFDTTQQGEGIVDVTVHLTDLIMWATFPDQIIDYTKDVEILESKRWPTLITLDQYKKVTHLDIDAFPDFLQSSVNADGVLECYGNGSITYNLKGVVAQAKVEWRYQAPEGTKDTHFALMRGSKCDLVIRQGKEQNFKPELYVVAAKGQDAGELEAALKKAVEGLQGKWAGVAVVKEGNNLHVTVPDEYRIGHEAHFGQVTERFLQYLIDGKLPQWEVPNMTAKYYTTTTALQTAEKVESGAKVEFVQGKDKIDVVIGGQLFTSYMYGDGLTKPVLYPVKTPSGIKVNRGFPFEKIEGEATDHAHHVGIFFTYDIVNDVGFWNNKTSPPQVIHKKVTAMKGGVGKGELSTVMDWTGMNENVLLRETRKMVFTAGKDQYTIDFSIDLTAQDEKVVFGDTKEGMFAIRTAQWLREKDGTGHYISSNGDETAKNIWGKRAKWVALEGNKDGKEVGIMIVNNEPSVNYPTYWHARDYGLFAANPLGQLAFQKTLKVENPKPFALTLEPGESAHFNFQVVIYDGKRFATGNKPAKAGQRKSGDDIKLGLVTYQWGKDWDLSTLIANCEKAGYDGVELRVEHAHNVSDKLTAKERRAVKKQFAKSKVTFVGMGCNWAFHETDPAKLAANIEGAKSYVKLSFDCGGTGIKVKPNNLPKGVSVAKTCEQIGNALNEVGKYAARYDQEIRVEVHGKGTSDLPVMKQIFDHVTQPNVTVCWNCNDQDLDGKGLEYNFNLVKNRFGTAMHAREFNIGSYPYQELIDLFVEMDYDGWFLLEARTKPEDRIAAMIEQREVFEKMVKNAQAK